MKFNLKTDIEFIISKFEESGYEAYIVGGCVRDILLGIEPKDYDICTNALPYETMEVFKDYHIIETGVKHGTITLRLNNESYEITTFRTEGEYKDNRRPSEVEFVSSIEKDLERRDFTINAMAYNHKKGLIDYFEGQEDLENKLIVSVNEPKKRFEEDALRIMRGLRFASTYNFKIEEKTSKGMRESAHLLKNISAERINIELCKMIVGDNVEYIFMNYVDVLEVIIPELKPMIGCKQYNPHHKYDVYTHTIKAMIATPKDVVIRLTMLLHDMGKPKTFTRDEKGIGHFYGHGEVSVEIARKILNRLKSDNKTKKMILKLIEVHDVRMATSEKTVRRWLNKLGEEVFLNLMEVQRGDILGQSDTFLEEKLEKNQELRRLYKKIKEEELCFSLKDLAINGNDLIELGISNGEEIGSILKELLEMVIEEKIENKKEILEKWIKNNYKKIKIIEKL